MNNAGFRVISNPIAVGPQGTKNVGSKRVDLHDTERQFPESWQLIKSQHYSKSAVALDATEDKAQSEQDDDESLPSAPPVTFDSLFMQMEKKILEQNSIPATMAHEKPAAGDAPQESQAAIVGSRVAPKPDVALAKVLHFPQNQTRRVMDQEKPSIPVQKQADVQSATVHSTTPAVPIGRAAVMDLSKVLAQAGIEIDQQDSADGPLDRLNVASQSGEANGAPAGVGTSEPAHQGARDREERDSLDQSGQDRGKSAPVNAGPVAAFGMPVSVAADLPGAGPQSSAPALADQISSALKSDPAISEVTALPDGVHRTITLRLSPEGMGHLSIRMEKVDGTLKVSFSAERESTTESLRAGSSDLARALESAIPGFSAGDLSFNAAPQKDGDTRQDLKQSGLNPGVMSNEQRREQASRQQEAPNSIQDQRLSGRQEIANETLSSALRSGRHDGGAVYV